MHLSLTSFSHFVATISQSEWTLTLPRKKSARGWQSKVWWHGLARDSHGGHKEDASLLSPLFTADFPSVLLSCFLILHGKLTRGLGGTGLQGIPRVVTKRTLTLFWLFWRPFCALLYTKRPLPLCFRAPSCALILYLSWKHDKPWKG